MPRNTLRIIRHQCIGRLASNNTNSPVGGFVCMHLSVGARVRSSDQPRILYYFSKPINNLETSSRWGEFLSTTAAAFSGLPRILSLLTNVIFTRWPPWVNVSARPI
jgi:hypothetical protein